MFPLRRKGFAPIDTFQVTPANDSLNCVVCNGTPKTDFNKKYALDIVGDSITTPNDSLIYRWWGRYGLYTSLTQRPDVLEEDLTIKAFFISYSSSFMPTLDSIKRDIRETELTGFTEGSINGLQTRLSLLSPSNDMETNALAYTGYYFNMARGAQTFEDLEEDIQAIADQCVFYGGPSVIEARAMLMNFDHSLLRYEWVDTCVTPSSKMDQQEEANTTNTVKAKSYLLVPNFYAGSRSGSITLGANETGELLVYSVDGRLVADYELVEGENGIDLTIIGKVKGMYLYKVYINGKFEHTDKIVIIE